MFGAAWATHVGPWSPRKPVTQPEARTLSWGRGAAAARQRGVPAGPRAGLDQGLGSVLDAPRPPGCTPPPPSPPDAWPSPPPQCSTPSAREPDSGQRPPLLRGTEWGPPLGDGLPYTHSASLRLCPPARQARRPPRPRSTENTLSEASRRPLGSGCTEQAAWERDPRRGRPPGEGPRCGLTAGAGGECPIPVEGETWAQEGAEAPVRHKGEESQRDM